MALRLPICVRQIRAKRSLMLLKIMTRFARSLIAFIAVLSTAATAVIGQVPFTRTPSTIIADKHKRSAFLVEVAPSAVGDEEGLFASEADRIVTILAKRSRKSPVFIDETGHNRE